MILANVLCIHSFGSYRNSWIILFHLLLRLIWTRMCATTKGLCAHIDLLDERAHCGVQYGCEWISARTRIINFKYQHSLIFWFDWNLFGLATVVANVQWSRFYAFHWLCTELFTAAHCNFAFHIVTAMALFIPFVVIVDVIVVEFSIGNFQFPAMIMGEFKFTK